MKTINIYLRTITFWIIILLSFYIPAFGLGWLVTYIAKLFGYELDLILTTWMLINIFLMGMGLRTSYKIFKDTYGNDK